MFGFFKKTLDLATDLTSEVIATAVNLPHDVVEAIDDLIEKTEDKIK